MKKIFFWINFILVINSYGQNEIKISFTNETTKLRFTNETQIKSISFKFENILDILKTQIHVDSLENYSVHIKLNAEKSSLTKTDSIFEFNEEPIKFTNIKKVNEVFLKIHKDTISKDVRELTFDIKIYKKDSLINNGGNNKTYKIIIEPYKLKTIRGYEHLAYIGTNFDLVEGIEANNLFFATNVYIAPKRTVKKNVGFYLSLYGNRAFSQIDSTSVSYATKTIEPESNDTYKEITTNNYLLTKRITDNIGVYVSPLFKTPFIKNANYKSDLALYYSPSLEFVYRRTRVSIQDVGNIQRDTLSVDGIFNEIIKPVNQSNPNKSNEFNEYSFNLGVIGLFLAYENKTSVSEFTLQLAILQIIQLIFQKPATHKKFVKKVISIFPDVLG